MEFTLYYRGPLKAATSSKKRAREKHELRRSIHTQLKELWNQKPLSEHSEFLQPKKETATWMGEVEGGDLVIGSEDITLLREVKEFQFVPTISADLDMVADLTITLLRPEPPGRIVTQGGDIDNRLKTLLDALKVPREAEIPPGAGPLEDESPFFCLLEDDALITSLDVRTDRLLVPNAGQSEIVLLLHVRTRIVQGNFANLGLV